MLGNLLKPRRNKENLKSWDSRAQAPIPSGFVLFFGGEISLELHDVGKPTKCYFTENIFHLQASSQEVTPKAKTFCAGETGTGH